MKGPPIAMLMSVMLVEVVHEATVKQSTPAVSYHLHGMTIDAI
jgi:hypothetical protein